MLLNIIMSSKIKIIIQEIGTEYLGLFSFEFRKDPGSLIPANDQSSPDWWLQFPSSCYFPSSLSWFWSQPFLRTTSISRNNMSWSCKRRCRLLTPRAWIFSLNHCLGLLGRGGGARRSWGFSHLELCKGGVLSLGLLLSPFLEPCQAVNAGEVRRRDRGTAPGLALHPYSHRSQSCCTGHRTAQFFLTLT